MTNLQERIEQLPELPVEAFEVAGKIDYSDNLPVITLQPLKLPSPEKPKPAPIELGVPIPAWSITEYAMMVTYPKVICQPPIIDPTPDQVDSRALFRQEKIGRSNEPKPNHERFKKERFYKLTTLKGTKLQSPWWCSVKYGPWVAHVRQEAFCIDIPDNWIVTVGEIPELYLSWYGQWTDMPQYPNLRLFPGSTLTFYAETHGCCPGFHQCIPSDSCIPNAVPCPDGIPV